MMYGMWRGGEGRVAVERGGGRRRESIVGRREGDTDDMGQGAGVVREGCFARQGRGDGWRQDVGCGGGGDDGM